MKKAIIFALVFCQVSAFAGTNALLEDMKKSDPKFAQDLETMDAKSRAMIESRASEYDKQIRYEKSLNDLVKLGVYAQTRGHWLLDIKIARAWLIPTAVALAGIYGSQRHTQLLNEAAARSKVGAALTKDQAVVSSLNARARFTSVFLSAGVIGAIGFVGSEIKRTNELKSFDSRSEEEVIAKYEALLCETDTLAKEIGAERFRHAQTGQYPECK